MFAIVVDKHAGKKLCFSSDIAGLVIMLEIENSTLFVSIGQSHFVEIFSTCIFFCILFWFFYDLWLASLIFMLLIDLFQSIEFE